MNLVNIYNDHRKIFMFLREPNGKRLIKTDETFFPYWYEPAENGPFKSYTGQSLRQMFCSDPYDIEKVASKNSFEADIPFAKRYILDKIPTFDKTQLNWMMLDTECLRVKDQWPDYENPICPITCITMYHNVSNEYKTFFVLDYDGDTVEQQEYKLIQDFIKQIQTWAPDIWLSWYIDFDYKYIYSRCKKLKIDLAKAISPIGQQRRGFYGVPFPAGISILDYKEMWKKHTLNKKASYSLDYVLESEFGAGKEFAEVDFSVLDQTIKSRNIADVKDMVKLEEGNRLIEKYDTIRRSCRCLWEDLPSETVKKDNQIEWYSNNSRMIDMIVLSKAHELGLRLPNRQGSDKVEIKDIHGQLKTETDPEKRKKLLKLAKCGAFRDVFQKGRFKNLIKVDLSGAYPNAIISFCLDNANIFQTPQPNSVRVPLTYRETGELVDTYYFVQNPNAVLPAAAHDLLSAKDRIKAEMKKYAEGTPEHEEVEIDYAAQKSKVNSLFGVLGLSMFRLYDTRIFNTITFLIRDLLKFVEEQTSPELLKLSLDKVCHEYTEEPFFRIIYADTDSFFADTNVPDINTFLNGLIQRWAREKYGLDKVSIEFDLEGVFDSILILAKCRYVGYLKTKKGVKKEIKGVQVKRSDSTKYQKKFMEILMDKVMAHEPYESICEWINNEIKAFTTLDLFDIAIPCKINKLEYASDVVFLKAVRWVNQLYPKLKFKPPLGDLFYYIPVKEKGCERVMGEVERIDNEVLSVAGFNKAWKEFNKTKRPNKGTEEWNKFLELLAGVGRYSKIRERVDGKAIDVLAFDKKQFNHIDRLDIDWKRLIDRNFKTVCTTIFEAMGWATEPLQLKG